MSNLQIKDESIAVFAEKLKIFYGDYCILIFKRCL